MYYVYLIQSKIKSNWRYVGYSANLKQRLESHNKGENRVTKHHHPFELVFYEAFKNKEDAQRREKYLKSTKGSRTLKLMLKKYFRK